MGKTHYIICRECEEMLYIGKLDVLDHKEMDKKISIKLIEFMRKHEQHKLLVVDEYYIDNLKDRYDDITNYRTGGQQIIEEVEWDG